MKRWINCLAALAVAGVWLAAGCGDGRRDTGHPLFRLAEQCRNSADYVAAAEQYRKFLRVRPDSAAGHLALASVFDEHLDDPASAIHHYREFLRLEPDSPDAELAAAWLRSAEIKYRDKLNSLEFPDQATGPAESDELVRVRRQNDNLKRLLLAKQREIDQLKRAGGLAKAASPTAAADGEVLVVAPPAPGILKETVIYKVQPGDTLGRIARKFYGSSSRFRLLAEANKLRENSVLQVGQELKIPPLPEDGGH